jgi:regulator of extracellular matrix RemA (YlzA/DUF370 family)
MRESDSVKFMWIGNDAYIPADKVSLIASYDKAYSKKIAKQAKENNMLMDYSNGEKKESIIITTDGFVFISLIETYRIIEEYEEMCRIEESKRNRR